MDGIDAIYRADFADWKMDYFAGFQNGAFAAPRDNSNIVDSAKIDGVLSLGVSAAQGPWFYKAGYSQARVTYVVDSIDALLNGLRSIDSSSPGAAALADQLDMRDATYHLYTLGGRYDKENWLVQAEFAERIFDKSFFRDSYGAYIMAGYRINAWMPYVSIGKRQSWGASSDARAGVLATKVTGLLNSTRYGQKSITLGTSYELGKSTTLKGQVLWLQPDSGAYGNSYGNASSGYNSDQPPVDRLVTVNVNFIF
jgi:predicted porin